MKTYGRVEFITKDRTWVVTAEPHVVLKLKRVFAQLGKKSQGKHCFSDTPEFCRDLLWFCERYPLEIKPLERSYMESQARRHKDRVTLVEQLVSGLIKPRAFEMAIPARDYQRVAAEMALSTGGLLLGDDVGIGKSASAIAMLTDPRTRPALVVTLTHLPRQWVSELAKFAPSLTYHIVKSTAPYQLTATHQESNGNGKPKVTNDTPDVILMNYHKLHGWAEHLAAIPVRGLVLDEIQELRTGEAVAKYRAASLIAQKADFKIGLSVAGESALTLLDKNGRIQHTTIAGFAEAAGALIRLGEFVPVDGWKVRAFDGEHFIWRRIKAVLAHELGETAATKISTAKGRSVTITEDHSLYRLAAKRYEQVGSKFMPVAGIEECRGNDIQIGDHLLLDSHVAYGEGPGFLKIADYMTGRWHVAGDFDSWIDEHVRPWNGYKWASVQRQRYKIIGRHGSYLSGEMYREAPLEVQNRATLIYTQGRGHGKTAKPYVPIADIAYVLGFFVGDGCVEGKRALFFVENARIRSFIKKLCRLGDHVDIRPRFARPKIKRGSVEIRVSNKCFIDLLLGLNGGKKSYEKRIPEIVFSFRTDDVRRFIQGMLDSDGHLAKRGKKMQWFYTTTSEALARDLCTLFARLNVVAGITMSDVNGRLGGVINGKQIVSRRPKYQVHFSHYEWMGDNNGQRGRRRKWIMDGMEGFPLEVKKIEPAFPDLVYDLAVDDPDWPSFTANGFLVHNSATPIYGYGGEFYNVLNCLKPGALGTRSEFIEEWCTGGTGGKPAVKDPKAFGSYLRDNGYMLRRTRQDVGRELPDLITIPHYVEADMDALNTVSRSCAELARLILKQGEARKGEKMMASDELSNKLRQATGISKMPYVAEFLRLLIEQGERPVVFAWHRACWDILMDKLKEFEPAMYTGSESVTQKDEAKRRFVEKKTPLFFISLRAGAGIDGLQHVSRTVVNAELDWSPSVHEQNTGRVYRDGQPDPVTAYFLISETGSDPVVADVLGIKKHQLEAVRDPHLNLVEKLQVDTKDRMKRLAESYLAQLAKRG